MNIKLIKKHRHEGKDLDPGEKIDVPDSVGDMLIKLGVAEATAGAASAPKKRNDTGE